MKRAYEVLWITNYLDDIHADFFAVYHVMDWESLDGPLFILLSERLPLYEGAVQARIRLENAEEDIQRGNMMPDPSEYTPGQTMSMAEALSGDAQLMAMQQESVQQGWGNLFEVQKG